MPDLVVITRPAPQAGPLAQRLATLGREAVLFPLLDIQPLPDQSALRAALADVSGYALVAFVSPNAIAAACAVRRDWPHTLTLAVMGEGSRTALARCGIDDSNATIVSPSNTERTDSQTLLETLDLERLRGGKALILRGETGRELLGDALRSAGMEVVQVAAYRRSIPVFDTARQRELARLLACDSLWAITSSEALRGLLAMARELGGEDAVVNLQQKQLLVPHLRIEESARELGFRSVRLTGSGDEALLAALQSRP
ncbi:MAG: uroporphyrinogen-III synthase [Noviherbaspirillum sp.]